MNDLKSRLSGCHDFPTLLDYCLATLLYRDRLEEVRYSMLSSFVFISAEQRIFLSKSDYFTAFVPISFFMHLAISYPQPTTCC